MEKKFEKIVNLLTELKYKNIVVYDTSDTGISNYLIIATSVSVAENKKQATNFAEKIKHGDKIEGIHKGEWVIIDFDEIVVQLFASGFREKFNIDKLYKGKIVQFKKK